MKRVFLPSSRSFALLLALSLTVSASGTAQADLMSNLNPVRWLSGNSAENQAKTSALEAQKRASEAQAQADQALKAAQEALLKAEQAKKQADEVHAQAQQQAEGALLKAEQAKKQADELQAKAQQQLQEQTASKTVNKPIVKAPEEALRETRIPIQETATETRKEAAEAPENAFGTSETTAASETGKNSWNPWKRFQKAPSEQDSRQAEATTPVPAAFQDIVDRTPVDAQTEANETKVSSTEAAAPEKTEAKKTETAETETDETGSAKASASTPWNPLSWFSKPATDETTTANTTPEAIEAEQKTAPAVTGEVDLKTKAVVMETEKGNITFELYPQQAPETVHNFAKLVNEGFYNRFNMKFHRVVPGFVIQTGDPTGTGAGGSKERIPLEAKNRLSHNAKGIVAMARGADPNSATSQFYITLAPQTSLDGKYAIFGKVIAGLDVLDKIEKNDMLYGIRLVDIDSVVRDPAPEKKKFFSSVF